MRINKKIKCWAIYNGSYGFFRSGPFMDKSEAIKETEYSDDIIIQLRVAIGSLTHACCIEGEHGKAEKYGVDWKTDDWKKEHGSIKHYDSDGIWYDKKTRRYMTNPYCEYKAKKAEEHEREEFAKAEEEIGKRTPRKWR